MIKSNILKNFLAKEKQLNDRPGTFFFNQSKNNLTTWKSILEV